jgi:hypothetical protein
MSDELDREVGELLATAIRDAVSGSVETRSGPELLEALEPGTDAWEQEMLAVARGELARGARFDKVGDFIGESLAAECTNYVEGLLYAVRRRRELACAGAQVEIRGPDGRVRYRRPANHPDVQEALRTPGYSVRGMR